MEAVQCATQKQLPVVEVCWEEEFTFGELIYTRGSLIEFLLRARLSARARARVCVDPRTPIACATCSCTSRKRARLFLLARLVRAHVKCSCAGAAHPAAGAAPHMSSYVLNQANISV